MLISKAPTLERILAHNIFGTHLRDDLCLDLFALNKERKRLNNAQTVSLYLDERIYIATKKILKLTERGLIRIKRKDSNDWFTDK